MNQPYDIIGDIHGHAQELEQLLGVLGYKKGADGYRHPAGRRVIFLGDFIDRGPEIRSVLRTVREMVDAGNALTILGNHEMNAMRFHAIGSDGEALREHTPQNVGQHQATLDQFPDRDEWNGWIDWFAGLPLFLDLGGLRVVHACWDANAISKLSAIGPLKGGVLEAFSRKDTPEHNTISQVLNGPEAVMPYGYERARADGTLSREFRVKWWADLTVATCREAIFPASEEAPELPPDFMPSTGYPEEAPPTFLATMR